MVQHSAPDRVAELMTLHCKRSATAEIE